MREDVMERRAVAVLLAEGFEEIEAVVPVDVLRRLEVPVAVVGVGGREITGSHSLRLTAETTLEEVAADGLSGLILPGGLPGATNLRDHPAVISLVRAVHAAGRPVCAICAAPIVLAAAGVIQGRNVTGYPMALVKEAVAAAGATYTGSPAEADGPVVTGKGPGAAFAFAVAVAAALGKEAEARSLMKAMQVVR